MALGGLLISQAPDASGDRGASHSRTSQGTHLPVSVSQRSLDFDPHSYRREAVTVSIADAFGKIDTGFMTG